MSRRRITDAGSNLRSANRCHVKPPILIPFGYREVTVERFICFLRGHIEYVKNIANPFWIVHFLPHAKKSNK